MVRWSLRRLDAAGDYEGARASFERLAELYRDDPEKTESALRAAARGERLAELAKRLPEILAAGAEPASPEEAIDLANVCLTRQRFAAAARLYAKGLVGAPPETGISPHHYNAACAAVMAAAGEDTERGDLDPNSAVKLRTRALQWLRNELVKLTADAEKEDPAVRGQVERLLRIWHEDPHLASLREPAALAKLPPEQRLAWEELWQDAAAALERSQQ